MNRTELRDALTGLYNHTDDPHLIEEIRKVVEKITGASASASEEVLHGPFAYLVIVPGLDEEHWRTSDGPETMSGYVSLPMFTKVDPFDCLRSDVPARAEPAQAWADVIAERRRQIEVEGWTPEHDDVHDDGELALAAVCYALPDWQRHRIEILTALGHVPLWQKLWPWNREWWKPKSIRSDLVKAGALILAEIERLDRTPRTTDEAGA